MSFFQNYKKVRDEKRNGAAPAKDTAPLRLRQGCLVELDRTTFLARRQGLVKHPGKDLLVNDVGRWTSDGAEVHSFHLASTDGGEKAILQAFVERDGTEYLLLRPFTEVYPQTEEEWEDWTREGRGMLGQPDIILPPPAEIRFMRAVEPEREGWVRPDRYTERRSGTNGENTVRHESMLFARALGGDPNIDLILTAHDALASATDPSEPIVQALGLLEPIVQAAEAADLEEELLLADFVQPDRGDPHIAVYAGFEINPASFVVN